MKRKQAVGLSPMRKQGGFLLAQMGIVVLLLSVAMAYVGQKYWHETVRQNGDDRARLVGTIASTVNDAMKTYTTTFFSQIQLGQSITRNGYTVPPARVLAPTTADLNGLGFLASRAVNPIIYNGQSIGFSVQLKVDTASGCTVPTCNLLFQVTTTVPLLNSGSNTVDIRRATLAATTASPGNAGVSMPTSFGGNPSVFVTSNGTQTGTNPGGVAGLISVSNGYDSSGFFMFDRRDGSLPRTGDINMQDTSGVKHNINNAGTINSVASVTGTLQVTGLAAEGQACTQVGLIAGNTSGKLLGCNGVIWGKATDMPNAHRYLFTSSTSWTVPQGVKSALVTMAGGGGSGYGWRFTSHYSTGPSGGFVFSAPVNLVEGETITVTVGSGGIGMGPYATTTPVVGYPNYRVMAPPAGDDGLGGYPGWASMLVSPSAGILLECDGGSGAYSGGVDSFTGTPVPGNVPGAIETSGYPSYPSPNRVASGPYAHAGGPGACGNNSYGIGNSGNVSYNIASGYYAGGMSPFGYGSGGAIGASGCYVSPTQMGLCITAANGRDGVVMIDVLY
ncbi:glycine-rich domain-containing protein [Pseudomonas sp.]|uniref:glycine-rich domain-containing protein n=1 Tax=Pseudomonas sp. TaxID=306 RepID=UPI003FD795CF